jgi:hypothetical protein
MISFYYITEPIMSNEKTFAQLQPSDPNDSFQVTPGPAASYEPYHKSVCGSILHSLPTNASSEIFSYLRHGKFDAFRRSFDIYYKDIIQMKNEREQVNTYNYNY